MINGLGRSEILLKVGRIVQIRYVQHQRPRLVFKICFVVFVSKHKISLIRAEPSLMRVSLIGIERFRYLDGIGLVGNIHNGYGVFVSTHTNLLSGIVGVWS